MRHDIDLDLHPALAMAKIEAEIGISSTYFFMITNNLYNVFSKRGSAIIRNILNLGHHLGLHVDCAAHPEDLSIEEIAQTCTREARYLEDWFGQPVEIVSFHRPSRLILGGDPGLSSPLPHTYQKYLTKDIHYCSDSRGSWIHGNPLELDAFKHKKPLHILTHPIWWNETPTTNYPTLLNLVDNTMKRVESTISANCTVYRFDDYQEDQDS